MRKIIFVSSYQFIEQNFVLKLSINEFINISFVFAVGVYIFRGLLGRNVAR